MRKLGKFETIIATLMVVALQMPCSSETTADPGGRSLEERWANPAPEMRILPIRHFIGKGAYHPRTLLDWLQAGGFGGMVCSVKRSKDYLDSEEEWKAFADFVHDAHSRGMTLWLYDEYGYPSGTAGGRTLKGHPEWQAQGALMAVSNVVAGAEVTVDPPPGEFLFAAAYPVSGGKIERDKAVLLPPFRGRFTWRAPNGCAPEWRVFAIAKDYLFKGTHVERVSLRIPYINLLMKEPCARFIELTHERYRAHVGKEFPEIFASTFNDEAALQSNWSRKMPYRALPWAEDLPDEWRRETGRDLAADLPAIAFGATDGEWRSLRWRFWDIIGRRVSENYFGQISSWCRAHGIASGGHLKAEQVLSATTGEYGDIFRCFRAMTAPGVDNLKDRPEGFSVLMPLMASSAKDLNGGRLTMCEYCDHEARVKKNLESVTKEIARGVLHKMILSGINTFNAFHSLTAFRTDAERRELNLEIGRANELMHDTRNAAEVAVLYPTDALKMAFEPGFGGADGKENFAIERRFNVAGETLYKANVPFIIVDDDSVEATQIEGRELVYNGLRWKAIYLPGSDEVRPATKAKLEAFAAAGGIVVWCSKANPPNAVERLAAMRPVSLDDPGVRVAHRRGADGDVFYFWNETPSPVKATVRFAKALADTVQWNPYTGMHHPVEAGKPVALSFGPYSALVVTGRDK